jgi:hypothetical protein
LHFGFCRSETRLKNGRFLGNQTVNRSLGNQLRPVFLVTKLVTDGLVTSRSLDTALDTIIALCAFRCFPLRKSPIFHERFHERNGHPFVISMYGLLVVCGLLAGLFCTVACNFPLAGAAYQYFLDSPVCKPGL